MSNRAVAAVIAAEIANGAVVTAATITEPSLGLGRFIAVAVLACAAAVGVIFLAARGKGWLA